VHVAEQAKSLVKVQPLEIVAQRADFAELHLHSAMLLKDVKLVSATVLLLQVICRPTDHVERMERRAKVRPMVTGKYKSSTLRSLRSLHLIFSCSTSGFVSNTFLPLFKL
jgi:hypothetical protein